MQTRRNSSALTNGSCVRWFRHHPGCGFWMSAAALESTLHSSPRASTKLWASIFHLWPLNTTGRKGSRDMYTTLNSEPLPFVPGSFDLVYASEVIEHCANTSAFLQELNRMLRQGGTLLLSTPNSAFWPYRVLGAIGHTVTDLQHPGHVRFFSRKGLLAAIEGAGFRIETVAARHMYLVIGRKIGDPLASILEALGFSREPRFATGDHFWQLSRFVLSANPFWADTFIIRAVKP